MEQALTTEIVPSHLKRSERRELKRYRKLASKKQSRFRRWRKTRPFWAGFFIILGGGEIAYLAGSAIKFILISRSVEVAVGVGIVISIFGLTVWMAPNLAKLMGLLTLAASVYAILISNLGGFLLGTLLGSIGGSLALAWMPGKPLPAAFAPAAVDVPVAEPVVIDVAAVETAPAVVTLPEETVTMPDVEERIIDHAPETEVEPQAWDAPEAIDLTPEPDIEMPETREPVIDLTATISDEAEATKVIDITPEREPVSTDPDQPERRE